MSERRLTSADRPTAWFYTQRSQAHYLGDPEPVAPEHLTAVELPRCSLLGLLVAFCGFPFHLDPPKAPDDEARRPGPRRDR